MSDRVGASPPRIAAFVSPHGFGHAARSSAVMAAALERTHVAFDLFTTVPEWFFDESIPSAFSYHAVECDVGFRQTSALHFDLASTAEALRGFVPFREAFVDELAAHLRATNCLAVLCDISPLGIAVAERAGLPSVLVESFSWPYLYEPLFRHSPGIAEASARLAPWTRRATCHVQASPPCVREPARELVAPMSREATLGRDEARAALGLPKEGPVIVLTMGGYGEDLPFLDRLLALDHITFVVTGVPNTGRAGNLRLFDNNTPLFMPNVLRAADAVVAKLGYGTLAEVWREGVPFGYVVRPDFREMQALERFATAELSGFSISPAEFTRGDWIVKLPELLDLPRRPHARGGAPRVADILLDVAGV